MAKKIVVFVLGTALLSFAWMGVVSSVKASQEVAYKESLPLKFSVVQSKWERLLNFNPVKNGLIQKPAEFVFTLGALDLDVIDFKGSSENLKADVVEFKNAYLDAGKKTPFFTVNTVHGDHLIRALREGEKLKLVGFSLDSVLNFLGTRLEDNEWFLIDDKNRILAARQGAYVGSSYAFDGEVQKFRFEQDNHKFTFAIVKPKGASLAVVNFLGVLGIILIAIAVFMYRENGGVELQPGVTAQADNEKLFERSLDIDQAVGMKEKDFDTNMDLEDGVEDVQMLNLQSEKPSQPSAQLDYTDFLIDNPVLQPERITKAGESKVSKEALDKTAQPAGESEDWVKLAEELSANIDKFTKDLSKVKSSGDKEESDQVEA